MSEPENNRRALELFRQLVELGDAERAARLASISAQEPDLAARVVAMLNADAEHASTSGDAGSLRRLAIGAGVNVGWHSTPAGEQAQDAIGPYVLIETIGEGGFGVVWLAERREPMVQRVAIKIIKPGMDSRAVIARFEQERQTLALMDHPNVARVFDGGITPLGRPYFVMEYVDGEPLTTFCDRQGLTIRQRLELFLDACAAVQHAHTKGIIHRDLKPSNILVAMTDSGPRLKVIDFGVAKAIDRPLSEQAVFTEHGMLVGTPEYMSPEQAGIGTLDIDTRSDVYSLGVVVYELLTGALPFESRALRAEGYAEIIRIIREVEPPSPSRRLTALIPSTANEIAGQRRSQLGTITRQLRQDLEWIPLKAMRKDRTRRYGSAAELAADIENYLADRPVEAKPESRVYRLRKLLRRHRIEAAFAASVVLLLVVGIIVSLRLAHLARVGEQRALEAEASATKLATEERRQRSLVEQTQAFWTGILSQAARRSGDGGVTVKGTLELARAEAARDSTDEALVRAARHHAIAQSYFALEDPQNASREIAEAVKLYRAELGPDHELTRTAEWDAAVIRFLEGDAAAVGQMQEALIRLVGVVGTSHPQMWERIASVSSVLAMARRFDEARHWYEQLQEARRAAADGPESRYAAQASMARAQLAQDPTERVVAWREAVRILTKTLGSDHVETLEAQQLFALATSYAPGGEAAAVDVYADLLPKMRKVYASPHLKIADTVKEYFTCLVVLTRPAEAESLGLEALKTYRQLGCQCYPDRADQVLLGLHRVYIQLGDVTKAKEIEQQVNQLKAECAAKP